MWLSFSVSSPSSPQCGVCTTGPEITQALEQLLVEALNTYTFYCQYLQYLNFTHCLNAYALS